MKMIDCICSSSKLAGGYEQVLQLVAKQGITKQVVDNKLIDAKLKIFFIFVIFNICNQLIISIMF